MIRSRRGKPSVVHPYGTGDGEFIGLSQGKDDGKPWLFRVCTDQIPDLETHIELITALAKLVAKGLVHHGASMVRVQRRLVLATIKESNDLLIGRNTTGGALVTGNGARIRSGTGTC
jgi:hypothetical protein